MVKTQKSILQRFASDFYLERVFPAIRAKRTQQFITVALTLIAISFFGFFAINPTLLTIADLQKQLSDNKFVDQQLQDKISNLSMLEQKYNTLQDDLPAVFSALPGSPQVPLLMGQLQSLAVEHNLTVLNIHAGDSVTIAPVKVTPKNNGMFDFTLDAHGSQSDILAFLTSMSNFDRVITIDSIVINKGTNGANTSAPDIFVDVKGEAYYIPSL